MAVVDLFQSWKLVKEPWKRLFWTLIETALYLAVGTLPFIDNWAHIGGFFFGVLAAIIFLPYLTFGTQGGRRGVGVPFRGPFRPVFGYTPSRPTTPCGVFCAVKFQCLFSIAC